MEMLFSYLSVIKIWWLRGRKQTFPLLESSFSPWTGPVALQVPFRSSSGPQEKLRALSDLILNFWDSQTMSERMNGKGMNLHAFSNLKQFPSVSPGKPRLEHASRAGTIPLLCSHGALPLLPSSWCGGTGLERLKRTEMTRCLSRCPVWWKMLDV